MPFWPLAAGVGQWFKKHPGEPSIAVLQLKVKLVYE
jgi:hypothetical protein